MIFRQNWIGRRLAVDGITEEFPASVPGNIQEDYGKYKNFPDVMYGENSRLYDALEDDAWEYCTKLSYERGQEESVWFVSGGIDYRYDILLNGEKIYSYEGMFKPVELDLTKWLRGEDELCVHVYPHPKNPEVPYRNRSEANHSCKPPVCYGWDWNPRLLISGLWQDAYIETRGTGYIGTCEPTYRLSSDLSCATVSVRVESDLPYTVILKDPDGREIYRGDGCEFAVKEPRLWWCNGQGEQALYTFEVDNGICKRTGRFGFRRVRLLRNPGATDPSGYPKSRYDAPFSLELNGRRVFMKGANFVNPDIFWGRIDRAVYDRLTNLAIEAHMNCFRLWGGASFCKPDFYELCDEKGIMIWQEFMLACNLYPDDEDYLTVLEEEARAMIKALRHHPSMLLWCGGNELFNGWSKMTDQSHPLRLLNALCYEMDRNTPFMMTSPLTGMGHGGYTFYEDRNPYSDVFENFQAYHCTGYTEFGVPSISSMEALRMAIPEEELGQIADTPSWRIHHAVGAWKEQSHACMEILTKFFGSEGTVEDRIDQSNWLQSEGLKSIYEEARRQAPHCGGALNWCFNEPWITAANCSIIRYPDVPKPGFYAVGEALRSKLFSARIPKFSWKEGETFHAETWLLNDAPEACTGDVEVILCLGDIQVSLLKWKGATAEAGANCEGARVAYVLPAAEETEMRLILRASDPAMSSEYRLQYKRGKKRVGPKKMNM